ncbi:hypothetical protein ACNTMW_14040 [Planosporangium sp. 12N6]
MTAALPNNADEETTFLYDMHLDDGGVGAYPQTFTPDELSPLAGAGG